MTSGCRFVAGKLGLEHDEIETFFLFHFLARAPEIESKILMTTDEEKERGERRT
jgi:hypothetical protein